MYKESLHSRVSLVSPPSGEKVNIQQNQGFRYELKIQCVQMCQEHSKERHKQELPHFMFPRYWLHSSGWDLDTAPAPHGEGIQSPLFPARPHGAHSARPFIWEHRILAKSLLRVGWSKREHTRCWGCRANPNVDSKDWSKDHTWRTLETAEKILAKGSVIVVVFFFNFIFF